MGGSSSSRESGGAPSFGCMIGDRGNSEPANSVFSDDAPPSLSDVARRDASESSFDQNSLEVHFEKVTLNFGDNFSDHGIYVNQGETRWMNPPVQPSASDTPEDAASELEYPLSDESFRGIWQKGDILGSGSMGPVYEGYNEHGFFVAIKEVSSIDQSSQGNQRFDQLEQEISLLSQFRHDNIVRYLGTDTGDGKLYIFLELATKGSLVKLYQRYHPQDCQVSSYTRQILSGLKYLHEYTVVHRDIRCANILLDANGSVKLAGFGLAKATALNDIKSYKGTVYWMAPEVVNNRASNGYGVAADIWSLGCTVLEMLTRKIPYSPLEEVQALFRISRGEPPPIPETLPTEAQDFIRKCLQVDPKKRPTAAQLLKHPFVQRSTFMPKVLASPHDNIIQFSQLSITSHGNENGFWLESKSA